MFSRFINRSAFIVFTALAFIAAPLCAEQKGSSDKASGLYSATHDAAQSVRDAMAEALQSGKHIWIQIGDDNSESSRLFEELFRSNRELASLRQAYITVYLASERTREQPLSRYPVAGSYPQVIVLDSNGKLLASKDSDSLKEDRVFSVEKITALLRDESPKSRPANLGHRPEDKPVSVTADTLSDFEKAIVPYVKQARATLPDAKRRFLSGLPADQWFDVTLKLSDSDGKYEVVFVRVRNWDGTKISGVLDSNLELLKEHKDHEHVTCDESEILDWTISHPDGTEEGNFVGKFLEGSQK